ncbi:hypothetical protein D9M72_495630 [compost metagenome]
MLDELLHIRERKGFFWNALLLAEINIQGHLAKDVAGAQVDNESIFVDVLVCIQNGRFRIGALDLHWNGRIEFVTPGGVDSDRKKGKRFY